MLRWVWIGLAVTLTAGCATRATLPEAPGDFAAAKDAAASGMAPAETTPQDAWLSALGAPELDALVQEALKANPRFLAAEARAQSARARAIGAAGRWLPDLNLGLGAARTETPIPPSNARVATEGVTSQLTASWEVDVWARVLDQTRAQIADARAADADRDGARLSLSGQVARSWIDLIAQQQLYALSVEDRTASERSLDITNRRYAAGVSNALSVRTARSQAASARAAEAAQQDNLERAARTLQTLLARYPDARFEANSDMPALPAIGAAGAPADLLARRPDVAAAEARMKSAGLRVSAARKALLPRLSLTATASGSGEGLKNVTDPNTLVHNIIANLAQPIFNGGALVAEARASEADARAAAANYVETALDAWSEVESALSADAALATRETELAKAAAEAREAERLAEREYANGVATIFDLLNAQSRRIDAERGLIQSRAARVQNRIAYHVALGGGADTGGLHSPDEE
jgi:NodT family efflux transporter outer membrane factor (OMF) lipoprotein